MDKSGGKYYFMFSNQTPNLVEIFAETVNITYRAFRAMKGRHVVWSIDDNRYISEEARKYCEGLMRNKVFF